MTGLESSFVRPADRKHGFGGRSRGRRSPDFGMQTVFEISSFEKPPIPAKRARV